MVTLTECAKFMQKLPFRPQSVFAGHPGQRFPRFSPASRELQTQCDQALPGERTPVHSDRGGHYRCPSWLSRTAEAKVVRSMSRKACSPDNAACEGFYSRLKNELFYPRCLLNTTIAEFISALARMFAGTTRQGSRSPWAPQLGGVSQEPGNRCVNRRSFLPHLR